MKRVPTATILPAILVLVLALPCFAATPPPLVNYQGVLRDADERPRDGAVDMVFRFMSASAAGSEILVDSHTAGGGNPVTVSGGLFSVQLGGGTVADGSGPGTYTSLADVFRDHASVWLAIRVGGEDLSPRVRFVAAAYALNAASANDAATLQGQPGAYFLNTSSSGQTKTGQLKIDSGSGYGVWSFGPDAGGRFASRGGSGYAEIGKGDDGIQAFGSVEGGYFEDTDDLSFCRLAYGHYGARCSGEVTGGYFADAALSGYAYVGYFDSGIKAYGVREGGWFIDGNGSGEAHVGYGDQGIHAMGNDAGGYFSDLDGSGYAFLGYGDYGAWAGGNIAGGYFWDRNASGYAYVGQGDSGVTSAGNSQGGYFSDIDDSGTARAGYGNYGIKGEGTSSGGWFSDSDSSGYAYIGNGHYGLTAYGETAGGYFLDTTSSNYAYVGYLTYKISGNGSVNFVQNHPADDTKVIAYAAPEGDEVAVYTRGTARLAGGEARVALGETFKWVTNPDIGLTAHLTPVGAWSDLYVAAKSTTELVVRSHGGAPDAAFDYIVYGLRIGFEEASVVQPKQVESYIPSMKEHRALYEEDPGLRGFTALERFKAMNAAAAVTYDAGLTAAHALASAIHVYDPDTDEPAVQLRGANLAPPEPTPGPSAAHPSPPDAVASPAGAVASPPPAVDRGSVPARDGVPARGARDTREVALETRATTRLPVSEPVEPGDLLVLDPLRQGRFARSRVAGDPLAAAIASAASDAVNGELEVAVFDTLYASVKADASTGAIVAGDLLVASALPGHVMKAPPGAPNGTIVGKALASLEVGQGLLRVLVTLR